MLFPKSRFFFDICGNNFSPDNHESGEGVPVQLSATAGASQGACTDIPSGNRTSPPFARRMRPTKLVETQGSPCEVTEPARHGARTRRSQCDSIARTQFPWRGQIQSGQLQRTIGGEKKNLHTNEIACLRPVNRICAAASSSMSWVSSLVLPDELSPISYVAIGKPRLNLVFC